MQKISVNVGLPVIDTHYLVVRQFKITLRLVPKLNTLSQVLLLFDI